MSKINPYLASCQIGSSLDRAGKCTGRNLKLRYIPLFAQFVSFLVRESDIACDPVTAGRSTQKQTNSKSVDKHVRTCNTITSSQCEFCIKSNHSLVNCLKLRAKSRDEKATFIKEKGLCFG